MAPLYPIAPPVGLPQTREAGPAGDEAAFEGPEVALLSTSGGAVTAVPLPLTLDSPSPPAGAPPCSKLHETLALPPAHSTQTEFEQQYGVFSPASSRRALENAHLTPAGL